MSTYQSKENNWITGHAHFKSIIDQASSQDHLLKAGSSTEISNNGYYCTITKQELETNSHTAKKGVVQKLDKDGIYCEIQEPATFTIRDPRDVPPEARKAFKNLVVLGFAFMLLFTAFISLQTLQSTLNHQEGLGLVSLSCVYGATVFSCFIAPVIIGRLTTKWTIVLGYAVFLAYFLSNFLPDKYVLIPSSIILGLFTGPLWSAQSTYLTTLAIRYAQITSEVHDFTINKFNGVFCAILQTSQIWGNLISAGVLNEGNKTIPAKGVNETLVRAMCGAKDCGLPNYFPDHALSHFSTQASPFVHNLLLGIFSACAASAIAITALFLDRNQINTSWDKMSVSLSSQQLFTSTLHMLKDARLQALSPLVLFTGIQQGFVLGDFTKSYVNCALGIHKIGLVMVCFGAVNAITSISIGHIARHVKRYPIIVAGTLFNSGLLMVLLWWSPSHEDLAMFYVISGCLGLCDAIWQTQTNTMFGLLFYETQEAAFACYRMFQAVGFAVAFGYSYSLCVHTKVYIMAGTLIVSLVFYSAVEYKLQQTRKLREGIVIL